MAVSLDRRTFRRLVALYLWLLLPLVIVSVWEAEVSPWPEFSEAFDSLTETYFPRSMSLDLWLAVGGVAIGAHLLGCLGLLNFKPWGRPLFLWPMILFTIFDAIFGTPAYFSPVAGFLFYFDSALFGAIVLLCYSREHGGTWLNVQVGPQVDRG